MAQGHPREITSRHHKGTTVTHPATRQRAVRLQEQTLKAIYLGSVYRSRRRFQATVEARRDNPRTRTERRATRLMARRLDT